MLGVKLIHDIKKVPWSQQAAQLIVRYMNMDNLFY